MAEPYRFEPERVGDIDEGNNGSDEENDGVERLSNLNWCLCGRCEVRETARECVCCVEVPESENKLEGTLLTSIYQDTTSSISIFYFVLFL